MEAHYPRVIAARRHALELTQVELAHLIGISLSQLQRYESGEAAPSFDQVHRLVVALRLSYDILFQDAVNDARDFVNRRLVGLDV